MSTLLRTVLEAAPTSPTATPISTSQINLAWVASLNAASYRVYRNNVLVDTTTGITSISTGLNPNTLYTFNVSSIGANGQEGPKSAPFTATTLPQVDTIAPTVPGNVVATAQSSTAINVTWNASTDTGGSGLVGYDILKDASIPIAVGTVLSYQDTGLLPSTLHTYQIRARDGAGNKSAYAPTASATTQPDVVPGTFDFYLSPTGSDSTGNGTAVSPWAITAIQTKASTLAGKRVGLLNGTYRFSATPGISLSAAISGTAANHTVIQAVNPRQAILTNNSNGAGAYVQNGETTWCVGVNANYVDFIDLWVNDCSGHGIVLEDANNILIQGCKITDLRRQRNTAGAADTNHGGVYCKTQTVPKRNVTVRNCEIGDIYSQNSQIVGNNSNAIGDLFGADTWIIEFNTVYRCGVLAYWKGQTGNHIVRNNFVYDCGGFVQGYAIEELSVATTFNKIYNNIAICNFVGGPQSGNVHNGATLTEFYNNTIYLKPIAGVSDTGFGTWTCAGGGSPAAVKLYNNLIFVEASMASGYQELYSHVTQIAPRLRYTTNGGLRNYNSYNVFTVSDFIGGGSYSGSAGLTSIRTAWGTDANTEIVSNFGFVNINGLTPASFQLTGAGIQAGTGRIGGTGSFVTTRGAWDGVVTQIGTDFS